MLHAEDLVFLDESGVNRAMTPLYGRSRKGERAYGEAPRNYGKNITLLGALTTDGILACMQVEEATTADVFESFIRQVLLPVLRPGQVVLMDNLAAHKRVATLRLLESAGVRVRFLPRYSPEYNPIEGAWSKLKGLLRRWQARTEGAMDAAITRAFAAITEQDARGWFTNSGYTLTSD